ncbi:hypothetical protein EE612_040681, partial [Oryza sativa]
RGERREARDTGLVVGGGRRRRRCVRERRAGWPLCTPSVGIATSPPSRLVAGCFSYRCLFRPPVACDGLQQRLYGDRKSFSLPMYYGWNMQPI